MENITPNLTVETTPRNGYFLVPFSTICTPRTMHPSPKYKLIDIAFIQLYVPSINFWAPYEFCNVLGLELLEIWP